MRTIIVLCLLAVASIILPMNAHAAEGYICTVDQAGPTGTTVTGGVRLCLTDTAESPAWTGGKAFKVPVQRAKEFLAVGIAAMTSGKKVKVITDAGMTNVTTIYLLKD